MGMRWLKPIYVGDVFDTTKGNKIQVLEVVGALRIKVRFLDGTEFEKWAKADEVRLGKVKSPYDRTFCGIGFIGEGDYSPFITGKIMTTAYLKWTLMFSRCYRPKTSQASYCDKYVNTYWHNFQNFAAWWEGNSFKNEHWELDKDLIFPGNKEYGPDTCCIVPKEVNNSLTCRASEKITTGVYERRGKFYASNCPHRNSFRAAKLDYLEERTNKLSEIEEKFSGIIDDRVFVSYKNTLDFIRKKLDILEEGV